MHVKSEYVNAYFERNKDQFESRDYSKLIPRHMFDNFQRTLQEIAQQRNYKEGERIIHTDLTKIISSANVILTELADQIIQKDKNDVAARRQKSETLGPLIETNDYLFAFAMKELGCPDMPAAFGNPNRYMMADLAMDAEFKTREKDYNAATTEKRFEKQRRMNADKVIKANAILEKAMTSGKPSPLDVAKYAAEYQALYKRQEKHSDLWRRFHKKENAERMKLLEHMKQNLKTVLCDKYDENDLETVDPMKLAQAQLTYQVGARLNSQTSKEAYLIRQPFRNSDAFRHEPLSSERANEAERGITEENLKNELREDVEFSEVDLKQDLDEIFKDKPAVLTLNVDEEQREFEFKPKQL